MKIKKGYRHLGRLLVAIAGVVFFGVLVVQAAKTGVSRFFTAAAVIQSVVEPADLAVKVTPTDPEAHYTRALELINSNRTEEAIVELRTATRLRPHHYYEWLDLGVTLDRTGDQSGALAALRESVRLAPHFAQPHWQLGNLLFREGSFDEAFSELRLAARSDPNLIESLVALAWAAAEGNVEQMVRLIGPQAESGHLEVALFLARQGRPRDVVSQIKAVNATDQSLNTLRQQIVTELLKSRSFAEAYDVWASNHGFQEDTGAPLERLLNMDFDEPVAQNESGFGWQSYEVPNVSVAIDPSGPSDGKRSLRAEFKGDSPPTSWILSQIMLARPNTKYSIHFMAKTEKLITGGPPVIVVVDGNSSKPLAQSSPLTSAASGWNSYKADFSTGSETSAVIVTVQRLACVESTCPIFGNLWLSSFSIVK